MNLSKAGKVTRVMNAVAVGTSSQNGSILDMKGFDGVTFYVLFGTITDGTPKVKAQQGQQSNLSDAADLAGSGFNTPATDDNKVVILDIARPQERYVRVVVDRSIGSPVTGSVIDGVIAVQYQASKEAVTQDTTVSTAKFLHAPAEGTA